MCNNTFVIFRNIIHPKEIYGHVSKFYNIEWINSIFESVPSKFMTCFLCGATNTPGSIHFPNPPQTKISLFCVYMRIIYYYYHCNVSLFSFVVYWCWLLVEESVFTYSTWQGYSHRMPHCWMVYGSSGANISSFLLIIFCSLV